MQMCGVRVAHRSSCTWCTPPPPTSPSVLPCAAARPPGRAVGCRFVFSVGQYSQPVRQQLPAADVPIYPGGNARHRFSTAALTHRLAVASLNRASVHFNSHNKLLKECAEQNGNIVLVQARQLRLYCLNQRLRRADLRDKKILRAVPLCRPPCGGYRGRHTSPRVSAPTGQRLQAASRSVVVVGALQPLPLGAAAPGSEGAQPRIRGRLLINQV
ncbi:uncharacterized protein LOC127748853 [Frankliniella occidentalis]|uniref:Uncharacterized protein LOC127748853 n=1 Tax=Frankliniella occidentalis TaxID=133901 RepID=A0A9C6TP63_FRAOC|nr:uncharacterized protein LOC127748853 [Frankliniella occidentalis]